MRCFRHPDDHANAICQHCGKATCHNCLEDTRQGVTCGPACTQELQQAHLLTTRLKQSYGIGLKPPMPASVPSYFLFGLILLLTAFHQYFSNAGIDYLVLAMSAVFFVMAGGTYKRYRDICTGC